jgi:undecaprenyl-diphosphatase
VRLERARQILRIERDTLIAIATALFLVGCFAILASEVAESETEAIDQAVLRAMRGPGGRPVGPLWLQTALVNLSALGSVAVTTLVIVVASTFLILTRRARQAALLIACGLGAAVVIVMLKDYVGRERPTVVVALDSVRGLSFPSGHSLVASAIYPTLGTLLAVTFDERRLKVFAFATAAVLALLIGFTRVYLGVHYPSDVLGGWMLGLSWAIVCGVVCHRLQRRGLV